MGMTLREALGKRRSYYDLSGDCPLPDGGIGEILDFALLNTPSAFNSQSARLVLLLGRPHGKFWGIVAEELRRIVPAASFAPTEAKMNSFAAGRGTILFFEDRETVERLQKEFPPFKDDFPAYSMHAAGMTQLAVWTLLREAGIGASLQHYGNLVETRVRAEWDLPAPWALVAQMPFGAPRSEPEPKDRLPVETRRRIFS